MEVTVSEGRYMALLQVVLHRQEGGGERRACYS